MRTSQPFAPLCGGVTRVVRVRPGTDASLIQPVRAGTVPRMPAPDQVSAGARITAERGSRFDGTRWSLVLRAKDESTAALNTLFTTYQRPLLSYLASRGLQPADAQDLLNGLFAALLRRDFLGGVEAGKGRFRTFLLRSLDHYLRDENAKAEAIKRGRGVTFSPLGQTEAEGGFVLEPVDPGLTPDEAFDRRWALAVLMGAFRRLNEIYQRRGKGALCQALEPILYQDTNAPAYRELSQRLGMKEEALRTAASRMRGEMGECIRVEVRETVDSPEDWETECRHLRAILRR